jgi:hypothetical protein
MLVIPGRVARISARQDFCSIWETLFSAGACGKQEAFMMTREQVVAGPGAATLELQERFPVRTLALLCSCAGSLAARRAEQEGRPQ